MRKAWLYIGTALHLFWLSLKHRSFDGMKEEVREMERKLTPFEW